MKHFSRAYQRLFRDMIPPYMSQEEFTSSMRVNHHYRYITGEIGHPEEYVELCQLLRSASEYDEVELFINSIGGRLDAAIQIVNAIVASAATVHAVIEYECASAATLIFLACDSWSWSPYVKFMSHTASYGAIGKEHEVYDEVTFNRKHLHKVLRSFYQDFFTPEEIDRILQGKDVYLGAEELSLHMKRYLEKKLPDQLDEEEAEPEEKPKPRRGRSK